MDNVFIERWWRNLKYEKVYLHAYASVAEAKAGIGSWFRFYNEGRQHQNLGYRTPQQVYTAKCRWMREQSAALPAFPEHARTRKFSPLPTSPQAQQPTKDLIWMIRKVKSSHQPSR
jgi:hypothetical protein